MRFLYPCIISVTLALGTACSSDGGGMSISRQPLDPETAPKVMVDRFSEKAAKLMIRTADNGLPAAGTAVDFDSGEPFITQGRGPGGEIVKYYNFDVQPTAPAPIYALFREGESSPV